MAMPTAPADVPFRPAGAPPPFRPVLIAAERCKGCGLCVAACRPSVLGLEELTVNAMGHHPVRLLDAAGCTSCARCARVCPDAVLTILAPRRRA